MRKISLIATLLLCTVVTFASPLWMRYNTISPQGDKIAFSYKGDIYVVSAEGGAATQLTTSSSYDYSPIWSPNGKQIAYASDKNGNFDIYLTSVDGGIPSRVTTYSGSEVPISFSKNGKEIYYSTGFQKDAQNPQFTTGFMTELYTISIEGGRPTQVVANPVINMNLDKDGSSFIYENRTGQENIWRKHHVSSVARDIYYFDANNNTHKQLTTNVGEDRNPVYMPDGKIAFLSERKGGSFNVYLSDSNNMDNAQALTKFNDHPVRFLSVSNDGTLCYGYHGEIYTQTADSKPRKVKVEITNDLEAQQIKNINTSASGVVVSKDGQAFFTSRGDVFASSEKYSTVKRITDTPEPERSITVAPDGRTIAYASERGGVWNIYTAKIARETEVNFANATLIDEEPLFKASSTERFAPTYSPDGKELAFIENRNILKVYNFKTKKVRQITDGSKHIRNDDKGFGYSWSPDGQWFVTSIVTNTRDPYSDVAIISAKNGGKFYNITNSGYIDGDAQWVLNGNAILYSSNRYGMRSHASWGSQDDAFIAFLNQDAYDKFRMSEDEYDLMKEEEKLAKKQKEKDDKDAKKTDESDESSDKKDNVEVDLDKVDQRIMRLTPMSSSMGSAALSKDGNKLYFLASFERGMDLWELNTKTHSTKIIKKGAGYGSLELSKDGKSLYLLSSRPQKINLASKSSKSIPTSTSMTFDATLEREYMFNHVFTQQTKRFYNENYHGVDLVQLQKDYKDFLPHISNNYDFSEMLSEILGELNVSHTGSGYRAPHQRGSDATADLGLIYNLSYEGDGLKVDEVLENGPFDKKASKLNKGDIIEKIDGEKIEAGKDYFDLLNKKTGKKTLISIYNPTTKERWDEVVKPTSKGAISGLMYKRWVKTRAAEVERLSGGRLGYVHIESMGDPSYREVYSDILGKYNQYDGIVIDTRFNGGGRLHEDIEILFSGEKYLEQVIRGVKTCDMPSRRYNKHSIMITGEANYSNAHGTPWVYQHMKIGKLVGMPVPGTMTSVNWETLQDPTLYFGIPVIGYRTKEGKYLENFQIEPDFKVVNTPESLEQGRDLQLEKAVTELLKEIDANQTW